MSSRKDGFTLIELLAVIVVLAIVALIATPIILNVVEKAKIGSFKSSILSGYNALEYRLLEVQLSDIPKDGIDVSSLKLKNNFKSGKYKKDLYGNVIAENITNGEYCANGDVKNPTITKGDCSTLLVLPEDRMMDSYVDDELLELMIQYSNNPDAVSTEEKERGENSLFEQMMNQIQYFFTDELYSQISTENSVYSGIEKLTTITTNQVPSNVISSKDISYKQDGKVMVWYLDEDNDTELEMYIGQDGGVVAPRNSISLFGHLPINQFDFSNFNTTYVTDMSYMFEECSTLTSLDLTNFDTSNVTDMIGMFMGCENLTSLNLTSFNTSNVTNMNEMFCGCDHLDTFNLSGFSEEKLSNTKCPVST